MSDIVNKLKLVVDDEKKILEGKKATAQPTTPIKTIPPSVPLGKKPI